MKESRNLMKVFADNLRKMIDCSLLRQDVTLNELENFIRLVQKERFICAFAMPCYTEVLVEAFIQDKDIMVGGPVGFPTGAEPTSVKIAQTMNYIQMGADELDLVINVGWLKSGNNNEVLDDLKAVVGAAEGKPVKVILEVALLSKEEICRGCELVIASGADFIKTATGFIKEPTTLEHVKTIKNCVGDRIKIKAAGGIRDLDTVLEMIKLGVTRFGVSWQSAENILRQAEKHPEGIELY
jgi:deoxyribose-phosphate aldolase